MRVVKLFEDIDASQAATSEPVQLDQRVWWESVFEKDGINGSPIVTLQKGYNKGGCSGVPPTEWYDILQCDGTGSFLIDDSPYTVRDKMLGGNWFRAVYDPNGVTTGVFNGFLAYKTFT